MFNTVFRVIRPTPSQLILRFPVLSNLAFLLITAVLLVPIVQSEDLFVLPILLAVLSGMGALYRESWQFDLLAGEAVCMTGFLPFQRRRVIKIVKIEGILYEQFKLGETSETTSVPDLPGTGQGKFLRSHFHARLALVIQGDSQPTTMNISTARGPGCKRLQNLAEILAQFLELPLELNQ
jgi:hypothetical protein